MFSRTDKRTGKTYEAGDGGLTVLNVGAAVRLGYLTVAQGLAMLEEHAARVEAIITADPAVIDVARDGRTIEELAEGLPGTWGQL